MQLKIGYLFQCPPYMFEWIEMEIAKNREEYGLIKTDLPKQKIEDKKS